MSILTSTPFDAITAEQAAQLERTSKEVSDMLGFADRHKNLLGRYYDRIRLIPFVPDPFTVYLDTPSDLVRQQGLKVFDRMFLDDMIGSALIGYVSQVLTDARVAPSGDSKECKATADCLSANFERILGGLVGELFDLCFGAAGYGFSVATIPIEIQTEGQWAGYVWLKRLRYLEPHFLEPIFEPAHGGLMGWTQLDRTGGEPLFFSAHEVIHAVHNARRDPARGQSLILAAHPHWIAKTLLLQMRNYVAEWTIGKLVLSHDTSTKDSITKKEFYDRAGNIISNYLTLSGFALPAGVKHELISGNTNVSPEVFDTALKFCNQAILRTCSGNWTLTEEPEMGSKALAETQQSLAGARFTVPRERFRGLVQHAIVDRLCRLNGWRPEHWPKFTLAPPVEADRQARVTAYLGAVQAGAITAQPQDENWLRESFGAPTRKETSATPSASVQPQPPPPPDMGHGEPPDGVEARQAEFFTDGWVWVHGEDEADDFGWSEQPRIPAGGPGGGQFGGHGWVRASSLATKGGHWIKPGEEGAHIRAIHEQPKFERPRPAAKPTLISRREDIAEVLGEHTAKVFASPKYDDWKVAEDGHPTSHDVVMQSGAKPRFDGTTRSWTGDARELHKASLALDAKADVTHNSKQAQRYRNAALAIDTGIRGSVNAKIRNEQMKKAEESGPPIPRTYKVYNPLDDYHSERFAASPRWWERELSGAEKRINFRQLDAGLQGIIDKGRDRMSLELRKALNSYEHRVQGWIDSDRITPGEILKRAASEDLALDGFETALVDAGTEAWKFGGNEAVKELQSAGVPDLDVPSTLKFAAKVAPANPNSLGNFLGLLKSRAFIVRQEYEQEARSKIANTLMNAYNTGMSPTEAKEDLKQKFLELAAQKKVAPGTPGHALPKDSISETTVRTVAADAFGAARGDLYQRNSDFVLGIERNEVLGGHDGDRSHPVSEWVHGIKIRMTDPRWRKFQGAMAFNDRGIAIPLTTMDEPIEWSTEAEIAEALQKVEELSGFA